MPTAKPPTLRAETPPTRLRIGAAATSLGVSVDTLRRWERQGRIQFERVGGQRVISSHEVERLLRERPESPRRSSARNRLDGKVIAIKRGNIMSQVELACGPHRIIAIISTDSLKDLQLTPGKTATAIIKATTVIIETDGISGGD